jgi:hypothetical protein
MSRKYLHERQAVRVRILYLSGEFTLKFLSSKKFMVESEKKRLKATLLKTQKLFLIKAEEYKGHM